MRKIKAIYSYSKYGVDNDIQEWLTEDEDAQNIKIISVSGVSGGEGYIVTYILYEPQGDQGIKL